MAVIAKENGYFFNSDGGDRLYNADSFDGVFNTFFTSGVAPGSLKVETTYPRSMAVEVAPGWANVNGKQAIFEGRNTLPISAPDGTYNRIDTVVIRRNDATRTISLDVVNGTPRSTPVAPAPVRTNGVYELVLANVIVNRGATSVSSVTDTRGNASVCGIIGTPTEVSGEQGAGYHNSVYRGKYLGDSVTYEQRSEITSGNFNNLFVGDYWVIDDVFYRIAGFDYWPAGSYHHAVIVPDNLSINSKMNNTATANGAYLGSDFFTGNNGNTGYASALNKISAAFSNLYSLSDYLANEITNGQESNAAITSVQVVLMSELMVYGTNISHAYLRASNACKTRSRCQLPLFRHNPELIRRGLPYWLRDVASTNSFAVVDNDGYTSFKAANEYSYIRPAFAIKG